MHPIDLAVVVAYVALITLWASVLPNVKNAKDFFLAGRSLTWWVIGLSIIGTNVDTNGYIGASSNAYSIGIAQANFEWIGAIPAMIIAALIFIPLYWRAGVYLSLSTWAVTTMTVRVVRASIVVTVSVFAMGGPCGRWRLPCKRSSAGRSVRHIGLGTVVGLQQCGWRLGRGSHYGQYLSPNMFLCGLIIVGIGISDAGGSASFVAKLTAENPTHLRRICRRIMKAIPGTGSS